MTDILVFLAIGFFAALFFLNFYFRAKIMKIYKKLINNRIEFDISHIFSRSKMETEILPRYPAFKDDILSFCGHIKKSIAIAVVLVVLIMAIGIVLKNI